MAKTPTPRMMTKKHLARLEREQIQRKFILIAAASVAVLVILVLAFGILDQTVLKDNKVVAQVGSDTIIAKDFQNQVRYTRYSLIQRYKQAKQLAAYFSGMDSSFTQNLTQIKNQLDDSTTLGTQVLDQMIDDVIIRQEAKKLGITVSPEEIEAELRASFNYYPDGTPVPSATPTDIPVPPLSATQLAIITLTPTPAPTVAPTEAPATITATPSPTRTPMPTQTPMTLEGYQSEVDTWIKSYGDAMDRATLNRMLENILLRRKLQEKIAADVATEQDQVWARHILVADQATAEDIIKRLNAGEDWNTLATLTIDTASAATAGDYGWFPRGQMTKEFEDAAFALQPGQITQTPVQTTYGYHVIQVIDHQVRPVAADLLETLKTNKFSTWLTETRNARTDIVKNDVSKITPTDPVLTAEDLQ
ncbi:MAG TPA: peptidylprolyl isomerase [Anaerolineaceae bacterium]|nr:peptidylprolyl isomerase [Anaerolineaceae bacterium]HPN52396.1 peptidylprolyl isomerase [Anaerolineaceae bacterium]